MADSGATGSGGAAAPAASGRSGIARKATLGVFALAMIEVTAVLSIRNFPSMAEEGWSMIFWYLFGLIAFFLPLSLVAGELATAWPQGGGVYAWVRQAFGERSGFISIWCEWSENVVWFPTVLSFIAATFAYVISPALGSNPIYLVATMLSVFWVVTLINFYGERFSSPISTWGGIFGAIVPTAVVILLLFVSMVRGDSPAVPFSASALVPSFDMATLPFVATVVLIFAGMEMAGFHALETRDPAKDFPRAIVLSMSGIFALTVLGTLAIMWVVPAQELGLASGVMQAVQTMLDKIGAGWLTVPMALLIAVGGVAQFSTWLIGPAKGLGVAAAQGDLPKVWRQHNRHGSPVAVLLIQGVIGSAFSLAFLLPSVNSAYWILSAITTEVIIIMYLFLFASVIKLRYSQPDTHRPYRVPGGKVGIWIVAGVALAALCFSFVVGLFPPSVIKGFSPAGYIGVLLGATFVLSIGGPLLFWVLRKPGWIAPNAAAYLTGDEDAADAPAAPGPAATSGPDAAPGKGGAS
jgi:amino acid transporter